LVVEDGSLLLEEFKSNTGADGDSLVRHTLSHVFKGSSTGEDAALNSLKDPASYLFVLGHRI
jgi:hypothetical protein